jgi:hypothetical protein
MKNLNKNILTLFVLIFGLFSVFLIPKITKASLDNEVLYLADSMVSGDGITRIYQVNLDATSSRAILTEITGSPISLDQVDALAASEDGELIYAIDKNTSKLASIQVASGVYQEIGTVQEAAGSPGISGIVLAAVSPFGDLYVASDDTDNLYVVDKNTALATTKGKIYKDGNISSSYALDISGADLVFATDGSMYIWTNASKANVPKGLYIVLDLSATNLSAAYLGLGTGNFFTGLAIRDNGSGDLVGSDTNIDSIVVIDKLDASMDSGVYQMYLNGSFYSYTYGDMTAGPIVNPLEISKTVDVSYDLHWIWDIEKISSTTEFSLNPGESHEVDYQVSVIATSTSSLWQVDGEITVYNPNVLPAEVTSVVDKIGNTFATTTCDVSFPYILAPGESIACDYEMTILGDLDLNNEAIVEVGEESLVPGNSVQVAVNASLNNEIDEEISVSDNKYGVLASNLTATNTPYIFNYSMLVGPFIDSGEYTFENIATLVTGDTETVLNDNHIIQINVFEPVCTLTQGYWKTHSSYGPAPYDDTWNLLGEDISFYLSGTSYYEVLWTAPKKGNAYYQLAHQYIAAKLNMLRGAEAPNEVIVAISSAESLFEDYTPSEIGALKGNNSLRKDFISLASLLASYNEGKIGPGHCSN